MEIEFPSYQMCPRKHSFAKVMKYSGIQKLRGTEIEKTKFIPSGNNPIRNT